MVAFIALGTKLATTEGRMIVVSSESGVLFIPSRYGEPIYATINATAEKWTSSQVTGHLWAVGGH